MERTTRRVFSLAPAALLFAVSIFYQSCYYDNAEDLMGDQACDTAAVSYTLDIVPILEANCYECHSQANAPTEGSGYVLEGYGYIVDVIGTGQLVGAIDWSGSFALMPKNGAQLPDCERAKIRNWVNQGAPNN